MNDEIILHVKESHPTYYILKGNERIRLFRRFLFLGNVTWGTEPCNKSNIAYELPQIFQEFPLLGNPHAAKLYFRNVYRKLATAFFPTSDLFGLYPQIHSFSCTSCRFVGLS